MLANVSSKLLFNSSYFRTVSNANPWLQASPLGDYSLDTVGIHNRQSSCVPKPQNQALKKICHKGAGSEKAAERIGI